MAGHHARGHLVVVMVVMHVYGAPPRPVCGLLAAPGLLLDNSSTGYEQKAKDWRDFVYGPDRIKYAASEESQIKPRVAVYTTRQSRRKALPSANASQRMSELRF